VETVSSGTIYFTGVVDTCKKIVVRSNQIYHLSTQSSYESWPKGSLASPTTVQNVGFNTDMGVDSTGRTVVFPSQKVVLFVLTFGSIKIFTLNANYTVAS
jgi:hypothetical protein